MVTPSDLVRNMLIYVPAKSSALILFVTIISIIEVKQTDYSVRPRLRQYLRRQGPPLLPITHTVKQDVLDRESDITYRTLWWEGVCYVGEHVCGEGAAHPEACEGNLLPPCGAIGGSPLA